MAAAIVLQPPWCLTPGAAAYENQPMGDCCMRWRREWDTMTAVVGHLGHDVSKTLWVVVTCVLLVILASEHTPPSGSGGVVPEEGKGGPWQ
jgi:hypothetical protein